MLLNLPIKESVSFKTLIKSESNNIPEEQGIYQISNLLSGRIYLGRAVNIRRRIMNHINDLTNDIHHNEFLQRDFNYYGRKYFEFKILDINNLSKEDLRKKEKYWLKKQSKCIELYNYGYHSRLPFRYACHLCGKPLINKESILLTEIHIRDEKLCIINLQTLRSSFFICRKHLTEQREFITLFNRIFYDPLEVKIQESEYQTEILLYYDEKENEEVE